jgi:hypothetical protein
VRLVIRALRVEPGAKARIAKRDPADTLGFDGKREGEKRLEHLHERLARLHDRLYAESRHSLLLLLQGLDASGKDGVVRSVFSGLNPQGCRVVSFKAPASAELAHDYLWRVHAVLPARGEIGIFNRSHYEDVVAVRMLELAPPRFARVPSELRPQCRSASRQVITSRVRAVWFQALKKSAWPVSCPPDESVEPAPPVVGYRKMTVIAGTGTG